MVVLLVMSGKGGVGKSTTSLLLSLYLCKSNYKVSLLDLDITGPSLASLLGIKNIDISTNERGMIVPYKYLPNLECLSMAFLLNDPDSAVVWRGPRKNALIQRLCNQVEWFNYDALVIDTPPGILDEHITLAEQFYGKNYALSLDDVRRQLSFCEKTKIKILGLVENMSGFSCPCCKVNVFYDQEYFPINNNIDVSSLVSSLKINYISKLSFLPDLKSTQDIYKRIVNEEVDSRVMDFYQKIISILKPHIL